MEAFWFTAIGNSHNSGLPYNKFTLRLSTLETTCTWPAAIFFLQERWSTFIHTLGQCICMQKVCMMKGQRHLPKELVKPPLIRCFQKWVSPLMKDPIDNYFNLCKLFSLFVVVKVLNNFTWTEKGGRRKEVLSSLYFPFWGKRKGREGKGRLSNNFRTLLSYKSLSLWGLGLSVRES